ncbi:MAG: bifunctional glutamate N-acetyltransferase/amino-acid acetyltransferase ArgJ [Deltaproteobacteria bacterium]|nr:bifunctional glutamate N-acetyltransferase/amino-acid acetyltransferase ArgJ [Deltaproteobacteria bacterium]
MDDQTYTVNGFKAAAMNAGLRKGDGADLALIFSDRPATAAGVFTTNQVKAAPVLWTRQHLAGGKARAIVANAGNANACTGAPGLKDAGLTAEKTAAVLGIDPAEVMVASTGVIGARLDMERICAALPALARTLSPEGIPEAARAIMTTDSFPKMSTFDGRADGRPYRILGLAKGAGMIMPHMATMLCFILSDIAMSADALQQALMPSVEATFNRITVDGDTSTNDMVLITANGAAQNNALSKGDLKAFQGGLKGVLWELSRMIVKDGEGATKLVDVKIQNAHTPREAAVAARTVANSSLVKTAFYGQDPNWGRILAALGRSGIHMAESRVDIYVDDVQIVSGGLGLGAQAEKQAAVRMKGPEFALIIDLNNGTYGDYVLTCDLTHEYVSINADYRT